MLLVEIIATKSQNCVWKASINNKHVENEHIKRVSFDRFYEEVTGIKTGLFIDRLNKLPIIYCSKKAANKQEFHIQPHPKINHNNMSLVI